MQGKASMRGMPARGGLAGHGKDMVRIVTQILAGLMLLFGAATLFPKAYFEFRAKRTFQGIKYTVFGALATFFAIMAFVYAYHILQHKL